MTNPYYNNTFVAVPTTTIPSQALLQQFGAVGTGFDGLHTALTAVGAGVSGKADLAGATFVGAVQLPPVAISDPDMTKAVPLGTVIALIGASGTMIPPVAGNAGKALVTDGISYSWGFVLPAPVAGKVPRANPAGTAYALESLTGLTSGGVVACSGNVAADQRTVLDISAGSAGTLVTLPDARTLPIGYSYVLSQRTGVNAAGLLDAAGNILVVNGSAGVAAILTNNSTLAGTWKLMSSTLTLSDPSTAFRRVHGAGINVSTTPSHTVKALLHIGGDDFLLASGETTGHAVRLRWLRASGLDVAEIANATISATGTLVQRVELLRTASGSYVLLRRCAGSNDTFATAFTLAGNAINAGATVNVLTVTNNNPNTAGQYGLAWSAAVNGNTVLLLGWGSGTPGVSLVAFTVAGTVISAGVKTDLRATAAAYTYGSVAACVEADKWLVGYGTDVATVGIYALIVTAAGTVLTLGAEQLVLSTCGAIAVAVASSGKAWAAYLQKNTSQANIVPIDITGATLAVGAPVGYATGLTTSTEVFGTFIELFPGDRAIVGVVSSANAAGLVRRGTLGTGAFVDGGSLSIAAGTNNSITALHRMGDLGVVFTAYSLSDIVMFGAASGTESITVVALNHLLGSNAKNTSAILLPGDRLFVVSAPASTNVAVHGTKFSGFQ